MRADILAVRGSRQPRALARARIVAAYPALAEALREVRELAAVL